jgi:hypothetical protein
MARLHAVTLGPESAYVLAKASLLVASTVLAASCATTPSAFGGNIERFPDPRVIHLETNQFLWVDATQREHLACANGTAVICTGAQSRLSLAHCGCLADD